MADATFASGPHLTVWGNKKVVYGQITAPADLDTWTVPLTIIEMVQVTQLGDVAVGTDDATPASISGSVVTWSIDGTARDLFVLAVGR